jgi:ATP-binding cassette subfamily C protein
VTVLGVVLGLLSIAPVIAVLIVPAFLVGVAAFVATLGLAVKRQRAAVRADERLAATAGAVLAGVRDVAARGAEEHAAAMVAGPIAEQAAAERSLARVAVLRTLCLAVGGWLPLLILLAAGPSLAAGGMTAGAIMGGLTYVLFGLQPALNTLVSGLGASGLRFVVTLGRILDASTEPAARHIPAPRPRDRTTGFELAVRGVTFAYGPHAEPIVHQLDLTVPEGDHLAIVGPSGIGKSTLAGLLCGLLSPDAGTIHLGEALVTGLPAVRQARLRVLIPQQAYIFTGTVRDNVTYLRTSATAAELARSVAAVGAADLVTRLGGVQAEIRPADLSAGERQLLALARAHLCEAPLVVLDEATCHLDPAAECRAERAFAERPGSVIVIAHRVSSALRARRVLMLDGRSAVAGSPADVWAASPLFRELLGHWRATPSEPDTDHTAACQPKPI